MTEYLLDTNIISELIRNPNGRGADRIWERAPESSTSVIVVAELRFGLTRRPSAVRSALFEEVLASLTVHAWHHPADVHYADIRAALEQAGTPIGTNDLWIAAHALALDCVLVTANEREFRRVPGLRVENWLA